MEFFREKKIIKFFHVLLRQSPPVDSELSIYADEQTDSPPDSPLPSSTKQIRDDVNAAVTKAGNDIERAADQDDDSDSDNEEKKPVFK